MDVDITGAKILAEINVPFLSKYLGVWQLTETLVVSWIVMAIITITCIILTRNLKVENVSKRQAVAEWLVELVTNLVRDNTGGTKMDWLIPLVAALFSTSVISNLISLLGFRSPTADLMTELAWAIIVFILITANKIKSMGILGYLKDFTTPIFLMTPFNILGEVFTPISMACRHFGNILSGVVINALIYAALAVASSALFGLIPGAVGKVLASIPILDVGIPAIAGVYFDWFSGVMQAFIFTMLTIMFISQAAEGRHCGTGQKAVPAGTGYNGFRAGVCR
jgi:F-type H+-transporting ATPase subunit a